jgi:predicted nucleotidyltransferase
LPERFQVIYGDERWKIFRRLRLEAAEMVLPLAGHQIEAIAYGSIARGDVSEGSDIDVFIPRPPAPTIIETILERHGISATLREIVQATPSYAAKGSIYTAEERSYSFPLVEMRTVELEFYGFAGSVGLTEIEEELRVAGVDKRLMLIEPNEEGHVETSILGMEGVVAKSLGISVAAVLDRVRTLRRREKIGRTGVFLKQELDPNEGFGEALQRLSRDRPAVRRRLRK